MLFLRRVQNALEGKREYHDTPTLTASWMIRLARALAPLRPSPSVGPKLEVVLSRISMVRTGCGTDPDPSATSGPRWAVGQGRVGEAGGVADLERDPARHRREAARDAPEGVHVGGAQERLVGARDGPGERVDGALHDDLVEHVNADRVGGGGQARQIQHQVDVGTDRRGGAEGAVRR